MTLQTTGVPSFELAQDAQGRWVLSLADGTQHTSVLVVRAFPVTQPDHGVSIMSRQGQELLWLADIGQLPLAHRTAVLQAAVEREFMPEIEQLLSVSGYVAPCTWAVKTNRGAHSFVLKGEEDIRRMSATTWLVADAHGVQYLIRDLSSMDRASRKMLDRFF